MVQICRWKNDIFFLLLFCGVFLCCCRAWVGCIFLHGCRMALPGVWGWLKRKKARLAARVLLCGGDSDRIQTCNLLIRSQMLYSVKLRGRCNQTENIRLTDFCVKTTYSASVLTFMRRSLMRAFLPVRFLK